MSILEQFGENVKIKRYNKTDKYLTTPQEGGLSNTPPHCHTEAAPSSPLSGFEVGFDFLRGKGNTTDIYGLLARISKVFSCHLEPEEDLYKDSQDCYTYSANSFHGIKINFAPHDFEQDTNFHSFADMVSPKKPEPKCWKFFLSISGSPLRTIHTCDQVRFFKELKDTCNFRATRIDVSLNDHRRICTYKRVYNAVKTGNITRFRKVTPYVGDFLIKDDRVERGHPTIYFGSSNSNRRLVFYDALIHDIDADRWEYRLKDQEAKEYFNYFTDSSCTIWDYNQDFEKIVGSMLAGTIVGAIDFINRKSKHLDRCNRLRFWKKFCDLIGSSFIFSVAREDSTIEKKIKWLQRQVKNTLKGLRGGFGDQQFSEFLNILSMPNLKDNRVQAIIELILNSKRSLSDIYREVRQL